MELLLSNKGSKKSPAFSGVIIVVVDNNIIITIVIITAITTAITFLKLCITVPCSFRK